MTNYIPLTLLMEVMEKLRGENGCPWDRQQTHQSLRRYVIEEAYEVADAIDGKNMNKLCEELGDLLLQVIFHAQIAQANDSFSINDVIEGITEKMIRRHPHVFAQVQVKDAEEVLHNWEEIKARERQREGNTGIITVPMTMPSLMLAEKVQAQVSKVGFDWDKPEQALDKVEEEIKELLAEIKQGNEKQIEEELGDLFFAMVNVSRLLSLEPEEVLKRSTQKFVRRFRYIEDKANHMGTPLKVIGLNGLEEMWQEAKREIG